MQDVIVALFALGIGVLFCFYGYNVMRILFPLWGLVAGYWFGARMVELITGDGIMSTALGIAVGIICGLVAAVLAYLYYAVSIILFMGVVGYWIGTGLLKLIGIDHGVVSSLIGLALAVVLIIASIFVNMPKYVLLLLTAFAGAALMIAAVLLVARVINLETLQDGAVTAVASQSWIWKLLWVGIGVFGLLTQSVNTHQQELTWAAEWEK